jgi:hypothetical protein
MTRDDVARIRADVTEKWRRSFIAEETRKNPDDAHYNPVAIGMRVAKALADNKDVIEAEVFEVIELAANRQAAHRERDA